MINPKKCLRCNYEWSSRKDNPKNCPKCKSPYWNLERTRKITKPKVIDRPLNVVEGEHGKV